MRSPTVRSAPRKRAPLRRRLVLAALGVAAALLAAEGAARAWGAATGDAGPGEFLVHDPRLGWRNRAGFVGRHGAADFDVHVAFGADGRRVGRGGAIAGAPAAIAIGDSTTFGWGVEQEEAFAARLGAELGIEVANLGVTGYGTDQQLLLLREWLGAHAPRLVVVTHTANDGREVMHDYVYRRHKPRFEVEGDELVLRGVPVPRDRLAECSHLWRTLLKHTGRFELAPPTASEESAGRELVARLYREMRDACAERSAAFVLAAAGADWVRAFAAAESIPFVDLTGTFARAAAGGPIRFAHDPHWLPRLHAAVAAELAAFVARHGLLRD